MRITRWAALVALLAACSDEPTSPPPSREVVQATPELAFQPQQVAVRVNGTITWEFGTVPHNVTFDPTPGRPADIAGFNTGTAVNRTFDAAGTYRYQCTIHPGMSGTVAVSAGNPSSPYSLADTGR